MYQKKQTQWLLVLTLVMLVAAPLAASSRTVLHSIEQRVQSQLRDMRTEVTQAQQRLFSLQSFAASLKVDSGLRNAVEPNAGKQAQWQSPIARTRLRLLDALSNTDSFIKIASSLTVERLERASSLNDNPEHSVEVERLWLSAEVHSVALGMSLLSRLDDVVFPYPLQAHGCSFRRSAYDPSNNVSTDVSGDGTIDGDNVIEMRCLLSLTAWALPVVRYDDEFDDVVSRNALSRLKPESETEPSNASRDKRRDERYNTTNYRMSDSPSGKAITAGTWRIFKSVAPTVFNTEINPKKILAKEVIPIEPRVLPSGLITGPLGTLLIHGK